MPQLIDRPRAVGWWRDLQVLTLAGFGAVGVVILLSGLAYAADQAAHRGKVARNVTASRQDVSSAAEAELPELLAKVNQRYGTTEVVVSDSDQEGFATQAGAIGLQVEPVATAERIMAVGQTGSLPRRWWSWLGSFRSPRPADLALSVDRGAVARLVAEKAKKGEDPVGEASIQVRQGRFIGVAGKAGEGIDTDELAEDLLAAAMKGAPIKVTARRGGVGPRFTQADADRLAERAEELVAKSLPLVAEATTAALSPGTLRGLLGAVPGTDALTLQVDEAAAAAAAEKALAAAGTPAVEPTYKLEANDVMTFVPGSSGRGCCGPEAGKAIAAAILQRPEGPVQLSIVDKKPRLTNEQAASTGVKERVSSFATRHPCCEPRVTNIHRIADIVRGQVIPPGGSFSVNEFVGERTTDKGFVVDRVISEGRFEEAVGGGVSQFATTLFNAAWFAGLEFGEYQSHSLAISRYPKAREATLGFPHPDLVIKNPSPYGVVIWPTYTNGEIRVTLYSTKWVEVKANGRDARPNGACTLYTTKRQRTFLDGRVEIDSTIAQYRNGEGNLCG